MRAIIMAAGKSTRTYPLTLTRPKPLLPVVNKPILAHQLDAVSGLVDGVVLVVGYRHEMIREAFGDEYRGLPITYVEQTEQKGTGHAVSLCAGDVDESVMVLNGDDLYDPADLARLAKTNQGALAKEVDDPRLYGIYEVDDNDRVLRLVEKPTEVFSNLANIGAYKFTPKVFDVLCDVPKSPRGEIEITDAVQRLAERGEFQVVRAEGYWLPIGYPWHLIAANEYFMNQLDGQVIEGQVESGAQINGAVRIGQGTVVRSGVVIDGPVIIGEHCQIGPNCWLRPGATIGNGCRIGQAVEIKNSIFFDGAAACHLSYVGDSVVGAHTNLGCGTVTANVRHDGGTHRSFVKEVLVDTGRKKFGAIIGDDVHTGIHTAIYPGRKMWPGTSTLPGGIVNKDVVD